MPLATNFATFTHPSGDDTPKDRCVTCEWIMVYRSVELTSMERQKLVDTEILHQAQVHPER